MREFYLFLADEVNTVSMEIKNKQLKHALTYGAIIGSTIVFYELLLYIFGMTNNKTLENVSLFLFVLGVFITVRRFRELESGGFISFKNAFLLGFLTCIFIGAIGAIFSYFQFKYMSPHLIDEMMEAAQENLINKGIPDAQIELQTRIMESILKPGFISVISFFGSLLSGSIMSVIVAVLLKRDENPLLKSE